MANKTNGLGPDERSNADPDAILREMGISEDQAKEQRVRYRDMMRTAQECADNNAPLEDLSDILSAADELFAEVKRPREAAMDSHLLAMCGAHARRGIAAANNDITMFRPAKFAAAMIRFSREEGSQSNKLDHNALVRFGRAVSCLYRRSSGVEPMHGALEWQKPKTVRVRKAVEKDRETQKKKPTEVAVAVNSEERQTEEITRVLNVLKRGYKETKKPIGFFSFVINPDSYALTVENIFHTSFLVREQLAIVEKGEDGLPVISPYRASGSQRAASIQCVNSISPDEMRRLVRCFNIQRAMIPAPADAAGRGAKRKSQP